MKDHKRIFSCGIPDLETVVILRAQVQTAEPQLQERFTGICVQVQSLSSPELQ